MPSIGAGISAEYGVLPYLPVEIYKYDLNDMPGIGLEGSFHSPVESVVLRLYSLPCGDMAVNEDASKYSWQPHCVKPSVYISKADNSGFYSLAE